MVGKVKTNFEMTSALRRPGLHSALTFAAGVAVVVLLCRKLGFGATGQLLKGVSLPLLALSAVALFVSHFLRAVRWAIVLRWKVNTLGLFVYCSVGYLINLFAPAQLGELVKPALVRARHGLPYFVTTASLAVERLLDVATLVVVGVIGALVLRGRAPGPAWIATSLRTCGLLCVLGFVLLMLSHRSAGSVLGAISKILSLVHMPARITARVTGTAETFLHGAGAAMSPAYLSSAMLCSLAQCAANLASVAVIFRAVNGTVVPIPIVLVGFAVLSLGAAIPLSPGCVGQYEGLWLVVFTALHAGPKAAVLAAGLVSHGLILLVVALLGMLSLGLLRRSGSSASSPVASAG